MWRHSTLTRFGDFVDTDALLFRHEAENLEDDETGEDAGSAIGAREEDRVSETRKSCGYVFFS